MSSLAQCFVRRVVWATVLPFLAIVVSGWWQYAVGEPVPPPDSGDLDAAMAAVRSIYRPEATKAKTADERATLAREVFENRKSAGSLAERYALSTTALDLASSSDDPILVMAICDDLATNFKVDRVALFTRSITATSGPIDSARWPMLREKLQAMFFECLDTEQFEEADLVFSALAQLARRARDPSVAAMLPLLRKSLSDRRRQQDRYEQLANAASAPNADSKTILEFGRLMCFVRNDWQRGIRFLAQADDPTFSAPAVLELAAMTVEQKLAAADAWVETAEKAPTTDREMIRDHAVVLFSEAAAESTGLVKIRAQKGLEATLEAERGGSAESIRTKWVVVFCAATPDLWNTDTTKSPTNYAVSISKISTLVKFIRLRRLNGQCVILRVDRHDLAAEQTSSSFGWNGTNLEFIGARMLGISDRRADVDKKTGVVAVSRQGGVFTGWGFGHRIHHGGQAELCWEGKWIPREPLEIAVIGRPLAAAEERFLLR